MVSTPSIPAIPALDLQIYRFTHPQSWILSIIEGLCPYTLWRFPEEAASQSFVKRLFMLLMCPCQPMHRWASEACNRTGTLKIHITYLSSIGPQVPNNLRTSCGIPLSKKTLSSFLSGSSVFTCIDTWASMCGSFFLCSWPIIPHGRHGCRKLIMFQTES